MIKKRTTYTVWVYDIPKKQYKYGYMFKSKIACQEYIDKLPSWQYIGTSYKFDIYDDDINNLP